MSTLYLLQSAGPAHHRLALEQLLLAQLPDLAPQPLSVFATATEPPAGERAFFWRPAGRSWLLETPELPTAFEARLTAERTDWFTRQREEEGVQKLGAAPALPSVGRLYTLQTEPDAQLLLRVYEYALQPAAATPSELLVFLPLGLLKGAWVWGELRG